jgi:hypothetical protein
MTRHIPLHGDRTCQTTCDLSTPQHNISPTPRESHFAYSSGPTCYIMSFTAYAKLHYILLLYTTFPLSSSLDDNRRVGTMITTMTIIYETSLFFDYFSNPYTLVNTHCTTLKLLVGRAPASFLHFLLGYTDEMNESPRLLKMPRRPTF